MSDIQEALSRIHMIYKEMQQTHAELYDHLKVGRKASVTADLGALLDYMYIARQVNLLLEDLVREFKGADKMLSKVATLKFLQKGAVDKVFGNLTYGWPDPKEVPKIPSFTKDPEGYKELLKALGVPEDCVGLKEDLLRINWPGAQDYATVCKSESRRCEIEVSEEATESIVRIRKRNNTSI